MEEVLWNDDNYSEYGKTFFKILFYDYISKGHSAQCYYIIFWAIPRILASSAADIQPYKYNFHNQISRLRE